MATSYRITVPGVGDWKASIEYPYAVVATPNHVHIAQRTLDVEVERQTRIAQRTLGRARLLLEKEQELREGKSDRGYFAWPEHLVDKSEKYVGKFGIVDPAYVERARWELEHYPTVEARLARSRRRGEIAEREWQLKRAQALQPQAVPEIVLLCRRYGEAEERITQLEQDPKWLNLQLATTIVERL